MLRHLPLLALAALAACSVDLSVPENVLVRCDTGECPTDYHCNNAHLCVPSTSDDSIAPTLSNTSYAPAIVGAGGSTTLSFDVSEALLIDPVVTFTNNSVERTFTVTSKTATHYELSYQLRGDERDGESSVSADLIDRVGNTNTVTVPSIIIDQKAPGIVASGTALTLTPERASNPLTDVTAITTGTQIRLTFSTDETITEPPVVVIGETVLFTATSSSSTVFYIDEKWNAPDITDGVQSVAVMLVDPAGNTSTVTLDVTAPGSPNGFLVDTTPPLPPVNTTLRRAPWGELGGSAPIGSLTGGNGAVPPGTHVTAYEAPSVDYCGPTSCNFASVGLSRAIADANGAFDLDLGQNDRRVIYLAAIDDAGNASDLDPNTPGLQPSPVASATLVATFNAFAGRTNPNTATSVERLPRLLGDASPVPFNSTTLRSINDGATVDRTGGYVWQGFGGQLGVPQFSDGQASAASLPRMGQVLVSALVPRNGNNPPFPTFWLRDASGLKRSTGSIPYSTLVYDPANDGVLAIASTDVMNFWDGTQWTTICANNTCGLPSVGSRSFVADPARRVVVLVAANDAATYEWDGTQWTKKCTDATCAVNVPSLGGAAAYAYDGVLGEVLVVTGFRETWSWNGSRWMRRCQACGPPQRTDATMGYDEARREVVLYGGTTPNQTGPNDVGALVDTWTWDGSAWHQESPNAHPESPFVARGVAFDNRRGRLVLMGGIHNIFVEPFTTYAFDSFWEWDGHQWSKPADFDGAFDAVGFDPQSRTTIGTCTSDSSDHMIRAWNGREWASTGASCPANTDGQLTRTTYGASDQLLYYTSNATYLYDQGLMQQKCSNAGCGVSGSASIASNGVAATFQDGSNVYRFNGSTWVSVCIGCGNYQGSTTGYDGSLTVDTRRGFLVNVGGMNNANLDYLDGATWKKSFSPTFSNVLGSVLAYDPGRGQLAWLAGIRLNTSGPPAFRPVLTYISGTTESANLYLSPSSAVPPVITATSGGLFSAAAAYDEELRQMVIFEKSSKVTYTYGGASDQPALILSVPLADAIALNGNTLASYTIDWYGTTTSTAAGIGMSIWERDHWTALTVTGSGNHLSATIDQSLLRYLTGPAHAVTVAVTPAGTNGLGNATLSTDAVSVQVAYRAGN